MRGVFVAVALLAAVASAADLEHVRTFKDKEFEIALRNTHEYWMILVLAPPVQCGERCDAMAATFEKVAAKASDVFNFGMLDVFDMLPGAGPDGEDLQVREAFNLTHVPALLIYQLGAKDMLHPLAVDAQSTGYMLQSAKSLYNQLSMFLPSLVKKVTQYSLKNFFTDEEQSLPRVLLFTDKKDTSLMYKKLSTDFHRAAVLGQAPSSDKVLAAKFGVTSFPTILVSNGPIDPAAESYTWQQFQGEISYAALKSFLSKSVPAITPKALRDQTDFESECLSRGGVCFVAVLPPQSSCPSCHEAVDGVVQESFLKGGSTNAVGLPLRFMWINGEYQTAFVNAFDRLQTPGLLALNPRKKLYATFVGSFETLELSSFVRKVMAGNEPLSAISDLPSIQKAPEPTKSAKKPKSKSTKPKKKKITGEEEL